MTFQRHVYSRLNLHPRNWLDSYVCLFRYSVQVKITAKTQNTATFRVNRQTIQLLGRADLPPPYCTLR